MKYYYLLASLCLSAAFTSCQKSEAALEEENCELIQKVKLVATKTSVNIGDPIHIEVSTKPHIALFDWKKAADFNFSTGDNEIDIPYADKKDEGWYYLAVSYPGCTAKTDSVYISVKSVATAAPCTPANNTVVFSTLSDFKPTSITWSYDQSWNRRCLAATGSFGNPDLKIYFNTFWDTKEPEDGVYNTTLMGRLNEYPPYTVYIRTLFQSILFEADGKVYVSHVNGKLKVTYCSLPMTGYNGATYKTTVTGALVAP